MEQTYVDIMIQSLKKKTEVLDQIKRQNVLQKTYLEDSKASVEEFDQTVDEKEKLISQLELLDSGFDKLFERVSDELQKHKEDYTDQIKIMQKYIREITDRSMEIQAQEARNKDLMIRKFAFVKDSARTVRTNSKAATTYYKNMTQLQYVDPQFLEYKK